MTPEPNVTLINEGNNLHQSSPVEPVFDATIARIMSKVQCFASIWALIGTRFDSGDLIQQAEAERAEIEAAVRSLPRR